LRERAVGAVMTLNFDLAMSHALAQLGAGDDVGTVRGPADLAGQRLVNLVYLHRNVDADPEQWVLRSAVLAGDWKGQWEELITTTVLASPWFTDRQLLYEAARRLVRFPGCNDRDQPNGTANTKSP